MPVQEVAAEMSVECVERQTAPPTMGGVWMISCVEKESNGKCGENTFKSKNRFQILTENDEEENEERWPGVGERGEEREQKVKFKKTDKWKKIDMEIGKAKYKFIGAVEREKTVQMGLAFQVTDVKKPLVAVKRIAERGNVVQFGPEEKDNYIANKKTGDKIFLRRKGGSYVMDVQFSSGGGWTEITVDSAAEDSVCPKDRGGNFGLEVGGEKMNFRNASGGKIEHYGQRNVVVAAVASF